MSLERSREVIRVYLEEVVANGEIDLLDDIAAEDVVDHAAEQFGWRAGRAGWVDHVNYLRAALPDAAITIRRVVADDQNVVGLVERERHSLE